MKIVLSEAEYDRVRRWLMKQGRSEKYVEAHFAKSTKLPKGSS